MKMLPVYRTTEGVQNLTHNYTTFAECRKVFQQKALVIIFSEAGTKNEWHLRPLRKGTARLAISSWQEGIPLKVLPVGINYSSFRTFGKYVHIYFGDYIVHDNISITDASGKQFSEFNNLLRNELQDYVYNIKKEDNNTLKQKFFVKQSAVLLAMLFIPALLGFVAHFVFYFLAKLITNILYHDSDHYDAVLTSILMIFYPLFLLAVAIILWLEVSILAALATFVVLPISAWACVRWKYFLEQKLIS
jgi:hypothetical protein